ncbi:heme/hemin ABC transporter substrate-binding protein [Actinokineospora globicatena]|uniref:heme/hemin ABC transporter substrate-binding protein n=1 Tax=Actinokineospora globicatena TaxID=103729 RepID=UPI0020A3EC42|nr:ABC transporter substrate-binding protein [Actinokineospora globicatena]MCP2303984.1 iron complex transport system substrate-binding protein [Actinokineospora globicatena]GLW78854.1 ABC transporter substrate-binding protein [Actinokineospora globicatena]GLW86733.1 ABC transporter substrate-binding protein [Actinokineospora globicatena]
MRVLLLVALLVLTGCSTPPGRAGHAPAQAGERPPLSALTPLADPRSYSGPTTALVAHNDIVPVDTPTPRMPVTVKDFQDTEVTVTDASRILALDVSGTLAATVFGLGLGSRVVGRDISTGFPAAKDLPLVTVNGHQLNAEAILKLRPSVVLTDTTLGPWDAVLQLRDAGVPVVVLDPKRAMETNAPIVRAVAEALGVPEAGELLARRMEAEIADTVAQITRLAPTDPARKPRVVFLYLRGQAGVYYLFGKGSGADSLIQALGAVDVATEAGIDGMRPINPEALAKAKPDVILMMTNGLASVGGVDGAMTVPGVAQTPAAQRRRFVDMADSVVLGFGPQTSAVLDGLARALYAP